MLKAKTLTGYPSIDKPWLKYYSEEAVNAPLPECTIYEYLWENNKNHLNDTALLYFGRKIGYRTLFENIDRVAASLEALGVEKGDIVTIQSLSLPQVVYLIYALSKIGAVANLIYITATPDEVKENLFTTKSKIYVALDSVLQGSSVNLDNGYLKKVIALSIENEMPAATKAVFRIKFNTKTRKHYKDVLSWNSFLELGKTKKTSTKGTKSDPVVMVYTGGTTGKSKAVVLSNQNLNVGARQYLSLGFQRHHTIICVLPPFIAFGLTVTMHMPLSFGMKTALCISADPTEIGEFVKKYKPNYIICGTAQAEKMKNALNGKMDLSFITFFGVGGDALSPKLEDEINEFLAKHHSPTKIIQGYAMSETSASSTAAIDSIHKRGTVGIPFVHTSVKIVDTDTNKELPYGEKGEICITSPCVMMEYYENEQETAHILKMHDDGKVWVHTGDIGSMDEDGFLTIAGRIKRMILTQENNTFHKVFPKLIEEKLLKLDCVEAVAIVGKPNTVTTNDLIAFIVISKGVTEKQALSTLEGFAEQNFEHFERPSKYVVLDKLPLTTVGKVDHRTLERNLEEM